MCILCESETHKNTSKLKIIGYWMKNNAKGYVNVKGTCIYVQ